MNHLNVIKEELGLLENKLIEFISSEITLATEISEYIVASGGKRIRPTLCILTGKALSYEEENLIYRCFKDSIPFQQSIINTYTEYYISVGEVAEPGYAHDCRS